MMMIGFTSMAHYVGALKREKIRSWYGHVREVFGANIIFCIDGQPLYDKFMVTHAAGISIYRFIRKAKHAALYRLY